MSALVTESPARTQTVAHAERPETVARDREGLLACLRAIDLDGWESAVASELLAYIRATVVRPNVAATRLRGPAADQAAATAWEATWEVLADPALRLAESPWGVLWATARRAALGELVAGTYCSAVRTSWRLAQPVLLEAEGVGDASWASTPFRHRRPISLVELAERGIDLPADPVGPTDAPSGRVLPAVVEALVGAGWTAAAAERLVAAVADGPEGDNRSTYHVAGWRHLANRLNLPAWQARRATVVILGAPGWPGLIERLVIEGERALDDPGILAALRSTVTSSALSPVTAASRASAFAEQGRSRAA